jgi:hypothetical protein
VQAYFWRKDLFWERHNFGNEDLILERAQQMARKKHAEKEGKVTCKRKTSMARRKTIPTIIGLRFLIRIVMTISL